jgi:hypothetical protein
VHQKKRSHGSGSQDEEKKLKKKGFNQGERLRRGPCYHFWDAVQRILVETTWWTGRSIGLSEYTAELDCC